MNISAEAGVDTGSSSLAPLQPNYSWIRPDLIGSVCEIKHYVRTSIILEVYETLIGYGGDDTLRRFMEGPFGHLLFLQRHAPANNAIHELLSREISHPSINSYEKLFHIGGANTIRLAAADYALVSGLMFGDADFNPNRKHLVPDSSLLHTKYNGVRIKVSTLRCDFKNGHFSTSDEYFKAANLLVYYLILVCRDNPWIEDWVWALVEDEVAWSRFPWGSYSFQILCHQIAALPKESKHLLNGQKCYTFFGPVWAFNIWAFEAVPELGRLCGKRTSDTLMPRLRRWITTKTACNYGDLFEAFQLKCNYSLTPEAGELTSSYYQSAIASNSLSVRYIASTRYAHKYKHIPRTNGPDRTDNGCTIVKDIAITHRATSGVKRARKTPLLEDSATLPPCLHGDQCFICIHGPSWVASFGDLVCYSMDRELGDGCVFNAIAKDVAERVKCWLRSNKFNI